MGSCNDKLKSRRVSKQSEDQGKARKPSCVLNVYDLSGALGGHIESSILPFLSSFSFSHKVLSGDPKEMSVKFKLKGNDFYHKKDYKSALENYNKAIVIIIE